MRRKSVVLGLLAVGLASLLASVPTSASPASTVIINPQRDSFASATTCTPSQFCQASDYQAPVSSAPLDAGTYEVRVSGLVTYAGPNVALADSECSTGVNSDLWFRSSRPSVNITGTDGNIYSVTPDLDVWMGVNGGALADVVWEPVPGPAAAPGLQQPSYQPNGDPVYQLTVALGQAIRPADAACSDIHTYRATYTAAQDDTLQFAVHDIPGPFGDNLGRLVATITPL